MIGRFRDAIVHSFRRAAVPLAAYYTVTLVIALANGAAQTGSRFVEHAAVVVLVPCVVVVLGCALRSIASAAPPDAEAPTPAAAGGRRGVHDRAWPRPPRPIGHCR